MNQYTIEYWQEEDAGEEATKEGNEASADEARYRDEWKGEWKPAIMTKIEVSKSQWFCIRC